MSHTGNYFNFKNAIKGIKKIMKKYSTFLSSLILIFLLRVPEANGQVTGAAASKPTAQAVVTNGNTGVTQGNVIISSAKDPVISVNLDLNTFNDYLPFDVDFKIAGGNGTNDKIPLAEIVSIDLYYTNKKGVVNVPDDAELIDSKKWTSVKWVNHQTSNQYWFNIKALKPNQHYAFVFKYKRLLTDAEKTKLTGLIQPLIQPLLMKKAIDNDLEFSDAQITATVQAIKEKMKALLALDGLQCNINDMDQQHAADMFQAIARITRAYRRAYIDLKDLNTAKDNLRKQDDLLIQFIADYRSGPNVPDKQKNIDNLTAIHQAIYPLYTFPQEQQLSDAAQVKAYSDAVAAVTDALKKVDMTSFKALSGNLADVAGSMGYHFTKYSGAYKAEQTIVTSQLAPFTDAIAQTLYSDATLSGGSVNGAFVTRSNSYVSADLGIAVLPGINKLTPYIGTNIYFRPINFDAPLTWSGPDFLAKRFSLVIGVSVTSVARTNVRADLLSSNFNIVTGMGFRIVDWIHLGVGGLWYNKLADNPLNTNQEITGTPYVSLTFDLRIKTALNNLFSSSVISSVSP